MLWPHAVSAAPTQWENYVFRLFDDNAGSQPAIRIGNGADWIEEGKLGVGKAVTILSATTLQDDRPNLSHIRRNIDVFSPDKWSVVIGVPYNFQARAKAQTSVSFEPWFAMKRTVIPKACPHFRFKFYLNLLSWW
jgi:hypothetical protein